jgi:thioredoxin reductase (NADPH)
MKPEKSFDVIILGGGPAGMTAAIYTARANLTTIIVDQEVCGGLVNSTYQVENFPSHIAINGMELMEKVQDQVLNLGVEVDEVAEITGIDIASGVKTVETEEYVYTSKAIILATGREPVKLDVETDCEEIHYCSVCDGSDYKGKKVLVVGGGNSGFDEALYLLGLGVEHITLIEVFDRFFASRTTQDKLARFSQVTTKTSTRIKELVGDAKLQSVVLENVRSGETEEVDVDGIFVYMGQKPNTTLFADIVSLDDDGFILANNSMETNIKGVYAAGDVIQKTCRQITTAMADGTIAALSAEKYIREK